MPTSLPNADTIFDGLVDVMNGGAGSLTLNEDGSQAGESYDVIIAVIGETPYAEGNGDISKFDTMAFDEHYEGDAQLLEALCASAPATPMVTLYVGGRPLWMNP